MKVGLKTTSRKPKREEAGQILVLMAFSMAVLLGFTALAIDLGFAAHTKREAQNDADAMSLAGVRELPNQGQARTIALQWGDKNGVTSSEIDSISFGTTCSGKNVADTITVRLARPQKTFLAQILGVSSLTLNVCATARTGQAVGSDELMPIGMLDREPPIDRQGQPPPQNVCYYRDIEQLWDKPCIVVLGAPAFQSGNSGPLRLDGSQSPDPDNYDPDCTSSSPNSGADEFRENVQDGSECTYAKGDIIPTLPGIDSRQSYDAISELLAGNNEQEIDVFWDKVGGVYQKVNRASPRFAIMPVIIPPAAGTEYVEVISFVTVYLQDVKFQAGDTIITVVPKKSKAFVDGINFVGGGAPVPSDWPLNTIKLTE